MEISIKVISGFNNRYIAFGVDNKWVYSDENISKILGIELHDYVERFKNVCNIFDTKYGIMINDKT